MFARSMDQLDIIININYSSNIHIRSQYAILHNQTNV